MMFQFERGSKVFYHVPVDLGVLGSTVLTIAGTVLATNGDKIEILSSWLSRAWVDKANLTPRGVDPNVWFLIDEMPLPE